MPATFGALVIKYREQASLTQSDLATALGVSKQRVSEIERDAWAPSSQTVDRIVLALANATWGTHRTIVQHGDAFDMRVRLVAAAVDLRIARLRARTAEKIRAIQQTAPAA